MLIIVINLTMKGWYPLIYVVVWNVIPFLIVSSPVEYHTLLTCCYIVKTENEPNQNSFQVLN